MDAVQAMGLRVELTDAQLVARCRTGDHDAWRELVDRFSRYVYAIAVQGFKLPEHDAEDVFQEVFTRAYEHLHKLRDDDAIRPWLAQLTRRLCIDRLRAGSAEQLDDDVEIADADDTIARLDESLALHEALSTLPTTARRSSIASSPGTRAITRSATPSNSPQAPSRAASPAA